MTNEEFKAARETLGYNRFEMAVALRMRGDKSVDAIRRMEENGTITGPMSLAVQKLLDDALTPNPMSKEREDGNV